MRALRALKEAPVMVGLIGWLDKRKKHRKPAHRAWSRHILRLRRIIDMRLRHGALPLIQAGVQLVSQPPTPETKPLVDDVAIGRPTNCKSQSANVTKPVNAVN